MERYKSLTPADGYGRLLFIATVFENAELYPHITEHLIMTTIINRDGEIRDGNGMDFDYGVPETPTTASCKAKPNRENCPEERDGSHWSL